MEKDGFSADLTRAREKLNLTQQELADRIGVSQQAVAKWETGGSEPRAKRMENLIKLFPELSKYSTKVNYSNRLMVGLSSPKHSDIPPVRIPDVDSEVAKLTLPLPKSLYKNVDNWGHMVDNIHVTQYHSEHFVIRIITTTLDLSEIEISKLLYEINDQALYMIGHRLMSDSDSDSDSDKGYYIIVVRLCDLGKLENVENLPHLHAEISLMSSNLRDREIHLIHVGSGLEAVKIICTLEQSKNTQQSTDNKDQ